MPDDPPDAILPVPEIRDYERINEEVARRLDGGARRVRLAGVEGQRLLVAGLRGSWTAVVEVEGRAGPELAAGLDAPGLTIVGRGGAADGLASQIRAGLVVVDGDVGDGAGYAQAGGTILVLGSAGHRAGLRQSGGRLIVLGPVGRLSGEARTGGVFASGGDVGPHEGRGGRGGQRVRLDAPGDHAPIVADLLAACGPWLAGALPGLAAGAPAPDRG